MPYVARPCVRRTEALGKPHNQGYADATLVQKLLVARHGPAVVPKKEHDRVLGKAFSFKPLKHLPDLDIKVLRRVEVQRPVQANGWMVRIEGRQLDAGGIDRAVGEA
jgi:hypothetical protein